MKNAYWGYWLVMLGIFVVVIMMLASDATTTNTQDYYQLKEVANGALYDSLDYSYYSSTKQVRIIKEIFVENFIRRFAETISQADTYKIQFYDLYESPPKVSVKIATSTAGFIVGRDAGDDAITSLDVVNSIDLIIELDANDPKDCGSDVSCDRSIIDGSQCPYYGNGGGGNAGGNNGGNNAGGNNGGNNNQGNNNGGNNGGGNNAGGNNGGGNNAGGNNGGGNNTPAPAQTPQPVAETNVCSDTSNMVQFDASGFKAYPMRQVNFKKAPNDSAGQISLNAGTELTVAGRSSSQYNSGYYWLVKKSDGQCGWVFENYMAVDLRQYIPEMNYDIYNASSAKYVSNGQSLSGITGQRLYSSDYKPIATYSFAKKLKSAATAALNAGDRLLVNDAYRPKTVSTYIFNTAKNQQAFKDAVNGHPTWFLSGGTSKHNTGCAVDITIAGTTMPTAMHELSWSAMKYTEWDTTQNPAKYSPQMKNNDAAKRLHNYMRMAGLQDLPSEWWHYQDDNCHKSLSSTPGTFWSAK